MPAVLSVTDDTGVVLGEWHWHTTGIPVVRRLRGLGYRSTTHGTGSPRPVHERATPGTGGQGTRRHAYPFSVAISGEQNVHSPVHTLYTRGVYTGFTKNRLVHTEWARIYAGKSQSV